MRTFNINFGVALCAAAFCCVITAQTNNGAAGPAAPAASAPSSSMGSTNPNETQFPHDAKTPPSEVVAPATEGPISWQGFETHMAFEVGGRSLAQTGNRDVYLTFVDLRPGFRLLDNSIEMHSTQHNGTLFDDFSESAFGMGGDPNEVVRVRARKHNAYDFSGTWRRDLNFFDYNLLGNPLNPLTNKPIAVPINVSPDLLDLSRKMTDLNLVIRPEGRLQFQLGYSHYQNGGASTTTIHESTDGLVQQPWKDKNDTVRLGVAWRPVERTRISYDQFYTHIKSDTGTVMTSFPYQLANGTPVNLGVSWNNTPCASPFLTGGIVNPTCSLFTGYSDVTAYYTNIPTEQLSFQTTYWRRLHITGRGSYSTAETDMPGQNELYNGYGSNRLQSSTSGHAKIRQTTTSVDGGVAYEMTETLAIDDQFRWYDYRIPAAASFVQNYLFGASATATPVVYSPTVCLPPYTAATCPYHTTSSSADQTATAYSMFQGQNSKRNTIQLRDQFLHNYSGYVGYRFERQDILLDGSTASVASYFPLLPNRGSCTTTPVNGICTLSSLSYSSAAVQINSHTGLIGVSARPVEGLRMNLDAELTYADNVFTNVMGRHMQLYRGKVIYAPKKWIELNAIGRVRELRDLDAHLGNVQHNRSYSFGVVLPFSARWGLDFSYNYTNMLSNMNICYAETPAVGSAASFCPVGYLTSLSYYRNVDHFGTGNIMFKPIPRATLTAGYTITSTNGSTLLLDPLAPLGPVAINYHLPTASVALVLAKHVTLKGGWNLYDYVEKSAPGPIAPRNFEANVISVALRYSM